MIPEIIILVILIAAEVLYIKIARRCGIVAEPCTRSSHTTPTVTAGGIIIPLGAILWCLLCELSAWPFALAMALLAGVSFADDLRPLNVQLRLIVHCVAVALLFAVPGIAAGAPWWILALALISGVGFVNVYNFMDGINGLTGAYTIVAFSALLVSNYSIGFVPESYLEVMIGAAAIFTFCNFRRHPLCFAGDVGAICAGFALLFAFYRLFDATSDYSFIVFVAVYGVDAVLTICRRLLHGANIFRAHRMHAYQLLSNEGGLPHLVVAAIYVGLQALIDFGYFIFASRAYIYLYIILALLCIAYGAIVMKYKKEMPH